MGIVIPTVLKKSIKEKYLEVSFLIRGMHVMFLFVYCSVMPFPLHLLTIQINSTYLVLECYLM